MMSRIAFVTGGLATLILLSSAPAAAYQCRLCDTPSSIASPGSSRAVMDLQIESRLDFDALVLLGSGGGTATLRPDGTRTSTGTIVDVNGRAMVGRASVRGEPGKTVRIDMPRAIEMHSISGGAITMDQIVTDLPSIPRLDSRGMLEFRFGGRLQVNGEAEGEYRGDVPILIEYL